MRIRGKILSEIENSIKEVLLLYQQKSIQAGDDGSIESVFHPKHTVDNELVYKINEVRTAAINFWQQNPQLPEPPKPEADPIVDLQNIRQWYIKNETLVAASGEAGDEIKTTAEKERNDPVKRNRMIELIEKFFEINIKSFWDGFWKNILHRGE